MRQSVHFQTRKQQRGVRAEVIEFILDFGTEFRQAGAKFYVVLEKDVPPYICSKIREAVRDRAVVLSGNGDILLTTYRRKDVVKYIKRKTKWDLQRVA